jgi:hypothetical protein
MPNDLQRRRAVNPLKIKIPSKKFGMQRCAEGFNSGVKGLNKSSYCLNTLKHITFYYYRSTCGCDDVIKKFKSKNTYSFWRLSYFLRLWRVGIFFFSNFLQLLENCVHPRGCTNTMHSAMTQNVFLKINKWLCHFDVLQDSHNALWRLG